jgi:hypothetical protein
MEKLAIEGGPAAKRTPFGPRKRHGEPDKRHLAEVIDSDMLFYFLGSKVFELQKKFAAMYGRKHCIACSSGTAAWFRIYKAADGATGSSATKRRLDGSITATGGGGDMELDNTAVTQHGTVAITSGSWGLSA